MIRIACTACQKSYRLRDGYGGQRVRCRECLSSFEVPRVYTERFERFLERAPKPAAERRARHKRRELPLGARDASGFAAHDLAVVKVVGGIVAMTFTSVMTFLIASVALG